MRTTAAGRRVSAAGEGLLAATAVLAVGYGAACKALLFRNFEYTGSDLYSLLDMSRSWWTSGRLLYDNAYGNHAAIHNFYLLLAFSPLTLWLGAYGLVLGLALLHALAGLRVARSAALPWPGRLAVLAGMVSPLAFYAADDRVWGFHPELCYPPLAVLLALALHEGRLVRATLAGLAIVLVKEDGALLLAALLAAHGVRRLLDAGQDRAERRRIALRSAVATGAALVVFAGGLLALWWTSQGTPEGQTTAVERLQRASGILLRTLEADGPTGRRASLFRLLAGYAAVALVVLLPLGARLARGLLLVLLAAPPVLAALVVSDAQYKFGHLLWAPRAATWLALVCGCAVLAAGGAAAAAAGAVEVQRGRGVAWAVALGLLSWALQLALLQRLDYPLGARLDLPALWSGRGYALEGLDDAERRAWLCLAGQLPVGLPVSTPAELYPVFHRQSIVFRSLEQHAARPARLRVSTADERREPALPGWCEAAPRRAFRLALECELVPALERCAWQ